MGTDGQEGLDTTAWGSGHLLSQVSVHKSTTSPNPQTDNPSPEASHGGSLQASAPQLGLRATGRGQTFSAHHIHLASTPQLRLLLLTVVGIGPGLRPGQACAISSGQGDTGGTHRENQGREQVGPSFERVCFNCPISG